MSENENKYDISKHPLVVIALAVVGTFGFSYQFVLPLTRPTSPLINRTLIPCG
jgi:hypothetical protein